MGKDNTGKFGIAMVLGAAAGYLASLFVSSKTRKKQKEQLTDAVNKLADKLMSPEDKKRAAELFKKSGKDAEKKMLEIKTQLAENLIAANKTISKVDKKKYLESVKKTIVSLKKKGSLDQKQLKKIQKFLEEDFAVFKATRGEPEEEA